MSSERGHYGRNGVSWIGQVPQHPTTVLVEHKSSTGAWILGTLAVGGALLWARHQSRQMEQIYQTSGMPYQSFAAGLRESAKTLSGRASETLRGITGKRKQPAEAIAETSHSAKARAR
jgi:hypothetical protein